MNLQMLIRLRRYETEHLKFQCDKRSRFFPSMMTYGSTNQKFSLIIAHY